MFEGLSLVEVFTATAKQCSGKRQNLLVCGTIGLFPILLLLGAIWIYEKAGGDKETRKLMAWSGLFSIILVLLWVNWEVWPHFLPGRPYPGFPHGLESVVGPFFFRSRYNVCNHWGCLGFVPSKKAELIEDGR